MGVYQTPVNPAAPPVNVVGLPGDDNPGQTLNDQWKTKMQAATADRDRQAQMAMNQQKMAQDQASEQARLQAEERARQDDMSFRKESMDREYAWKEHDATRMERAQQGRDQRLFDQQQQINEAQAAREDERLRLANERDDARRHEVLAKIEERMRGSQGAARQGSTTVGGPPGDFTGPVQPGVTPPGGLPDMPGYGGTSKENLRAAREASLKTTRELRTNKVTYEGYTLAHDVIKDGFDEVKAEAAEALFDQHEADAERLGATRVRIGENIKRGAIELGEALQNGDPFKHTFRFLSPTNLEPPASYTEATTDYEQQMLDQYEGDYETPGPGQPRARTPGPDKWMAGTMNPEKRLQQYAHAAVQGGPEKVTRYLVESAVSDITEVDLPSHQRDKITEIVMAAKDVSNGDATKSQTLVKLVQEYFRDPEAALDITQLYAIVEGLDEVGTSAGPSYDARRSAQEVDEAVETGKVLDTKTGDMDERISEGMRGLERVQDGFEQALKESPEGVELLKRINSGMPSGTAADLERGVGDFMQEAFINGDPIQVDALVQTVQQWGIKDPVRASRLAEQILLEDERVVDALLGNQQLMLKARPLIQFIEQQRQTITGNDQNPDDVLEMGAIRKFAEDNQIDLEALIAELEGREEKLALDQLDFQGQASDDEELWRMQMEALQ